MKSLGKSLGAALAMSALLATLYGCQKEEGPAERAGKQVDQTVEKAGEEIDKAVEKAGEEIDKAAEKVGEQMEKTGDNIKDVAKDDKK